MTVVGPFGLSVRDQALEADVQAGLAAVEEGLLEATKSEVPFITEAAQHLVRAGGKRFRPLLVMLAAQFGDPYAPGVVPSAVVVELTHLATLYHDDVMDEADVRRGVPSANTRWGNSVAVLTGDFLFARASHILADLGPEAVRIQAEAFERLVTGQILETAGPRDGRDPVDHYLDVLSGKTGSLIAVAVTVRRDDVGRRRDGRRRADAVRRAARRRLPARRRRAGHRLRLARVRQDAGHRPARGHPHDAGAAAARARGAARAAPRTSRCASCSTPT